MEFPTLSNDNLTFDGRHTIEMRDEMDEVIRTQGIEIVNSAGQVVIHMTTSEAGYPMISLNDPADLCPRISIQLEPGRASVGVLDPSGALLVGLGTNEEQGAGITLSNKLHTNLATLSIDKNGMVGIRVFSS